MKQIHLSITLIFILPVIAISQNLSTKSTLWNGLPTWATDIIKSDKISRSYDVVDFLNPFYLEADFDGDEKTDIAVLISEKQTGKKGILIMHVRTNEFFIIGAGQKFGAGNDDFSWMDLWKVFRETKVEPVASEDKRVYLVCPAIWVEKTGAPGSVIYWNGKMYKWYQQ